MTDHGNETMPEFPFYGRPSCRKCEKEMEFLSSKVEEGQLIVIFYCSCREENEG